ncbi:MAG TPA: permease [Alphaproteobacteria bacterium]|nr:permease [Alphaproteobacteria bacterium]
MFKIKKFERGLGIARKRRQYDLPLNKGNGGNFLKLLIALMTFLAMLGVASIFALSAMTDRWSSGLENKATIEIPAKDNSGTVFEQSHMDTLQDQVFNFLQNYPAVDTVEVMDKEEIKSLVAPWLGEGLSYDNIPLPGILTISFKDDVIFDTDALENKLKTFAPQIRLDTHQSWLADVLRFTGALNFAAVLITIVIGITTIVAVAGAVQSRMAIYHEELELLHLMGAEDSYISRQLQRYVLILSLQGAAIGTAIGGLIMFMVGLLAGEMDISLLPDFHLSIMQIFLLICLPLLVALLGMVTARQTVLRVLAQMP